MRTFDPARAVRAIALFMVLLLAACAPLVAPTPAPLSPTPAIAATRETPIAALLPTTTPAVAAALLPTTTPEPAPILERPPIDCPTFSAGEQAALDAALIVMAGGGEVECVELLLAQGASVTAADASGRTALIMAAYGNFVDVARVLVAAGADVNARDETQQSAYLIPTADGGVEFLRLMLASGADVHSLDRFNGTGLIRAADRGHVEVIRELLPTGIDVNHINNLNWTALLEAVILGDGSERYQESVRLLIEGGADVNLADGNGVTPLQHAQRGGYAEIARLLEEAGAR